VCGMSGHGAGAARRRAGGQVARSRRRAPPAADSPRAAAVPAGGCGPPCRGKRGRRWWRALGSRASIEIPFSVTAPRFSPKAGWPATTELVEDALLRVGPDDPMLVYRRWLQLVCGPGTRPMFREFHRAPPRLVFLCNKASSNRFAPTSSVRPPPRADLGGWAALHWRALLVATWGFASASSWSPGCHRLHLSRPYCLACSCV